VTELPDSRFLTIMGGIVVAGVLLYFAFAVIDRMGLANREATTIVLEKKYRASGSSYSTQLIGGNRTIVVPQTTPDTYIVRVEVAGAQHEVPIAKALYDALSVHDRVRVTYQRSRLTGGVQAIVVTR
jgi:hypothetical protein